ncbi:MAG: hypothetical protein P9L90_04810 [Candidatus Aadella gelida]|nr:hypothetical protein [Candidatus Aadella gelida]
MLKIVKRSLVCILLLIQVVSVSGCAAAWFLAGAGAVAAVTFIAAEDEKQPDTEYEEEVYLSEE